MPETTTNDIGAKTAQGKLIEKSGCTDIQSALSDAAKHGFSADDLSDEVKQTVIETMASAQSFGAQAAPIKK